MEYLEFITAIAEKTGFSEKQTKKTMEAAAEVLTETAKNDGKVRWKGVGVFEGWMKKPRSVYNPQKNEMMMFAGGRTLHLTVSSLMKKALN